MRGRTCGNKSSHVTKRPDLWKHTVKKILQLSEMLFAVRMLC